MLRSFFKCSERQPKHLTLSLQIHASQDLLSRYQVSQQKTLTRQAFERHQDARTRAGCAEAGELQKQGVDNHEV